jgi:hypothetical protein
VAAECPDECSRNYSWDETTVRKGLGTYLAVLVVGVLIQYIVELGFSTELALKSTPLFPWVLDAILYVAYGAAAAFALRSWRLAPKVGLFVLLAALPHVVLEITHGSDPAYPYIGLLLIVPDLLWVAVGALITSVIISRQRIIQHPK